MKNQRKEEVNVFLALIRAGLWESDVSLLPYDKAVYSSVYKIAEEQSVVGLVAAGIEHIKDVKISQGIALHYVAATLQLEQRNTAMNLFIAKLDERMKEAGISYVLVKGQGVAQCYSRPMWRAAGDIDLFLDEDNYEKARFYFQNLATSMKEEGGYTKHINMSVGLWEVELHGTMRTNVTKRMDFLVDSVQKDTFGNKGIRIWKDGDADILLPSPDNDVIFVFTHILHHFYRGGGIGLRQICDWCRLLYTYRDQIDKQLLRKRLEEAAIIPEWICFGQLAVTYLGMPEEFMPFYCAPNQKDARKTRQILNYIFEVGNFGHNRDRSYFKKYPYLVRKAISLKRKGSDIFHHYCIFPANSIRFFFRFLSGGIAAVINGKG